MAQDNNPPHESQAKLDRYRRLIDPALDSLTLENIRQLVREIEDQLASGNE